MRRLIFILIAFFLMSADIVEYSFYQKDDTNAKIKAVYLYNFTRNFEWPNNMREGNFVISTIGASAGLKAELEKLASQKMVANQKIEIKNVSTLAEAGKCNILFLTGDHSSHLKDAMKQYAGKGTLVITEKAGMAKAGSVINFIVEENKQKFELNRSSAEKTGLKISAGLKDLAVAVFD